MNMLIRASESLVGPSSLSRRAVLNSVAGFVAAPWVSVRAQDAFAGVDPTVTQGFWERDRWLWIRRRATGEELRVVYWSNGQLLQDGYRQASWFLRDVRFQGMLAANDSRIKRALDNGVIGREHLSPWVLMDPVLLDILYAYNAWLFFCGVQKPLEATSGFRHLITNFLTEGAARDSWHTKGGAADIIVPGVSVQALAAFGKWLSGGGVGLYPSKGFVHVDRGRMRSWIG